MLKEVTMKEIDAIFTVTDRMGLSRELLVIPLMPRTAGGVRQTPAGKLEIVVPAEGEFADFVAGLEDEIKKVTDG
jgi:hypothetical protein